MDIDKAQMLQYRYLVDRGKLRPRSTNWGRHTLRDYVSLGYPHWTRIAVARDGTAFVCPSKASGLPIKQYPDVDTAIAAVMMTRGE